MIIRVAVYVVIAAAAMTAGFGIGAVSLAHPGFARKIAIMTFILGLVGWVAGMIIVHEGARCGCW